MSASQYINPEAYGMQASRKFGAMEYMERKVLSREGYPRPNTQNLGAAQSINFAKASKSLQFDETNIRTQKAMLKYNLSPEEANKYQQFIRLVSTFEQGISRF